MPCLAIGMRQEFGSWKWFGVAFVHRTVLAWLVYQGGTVLAGG